MTKNHFHLLVAGLAICSLTQAAPGLALDDAEIVTHTLPTSLTAGETVPVSVVMRNLGDTDWTPAESIKLGSPGGSDPFRQVTRLALPAGTVVQPGETHSFDFTLTAGSTMAGTYVTDWRMIREGSHWFGPTASSTVQVSLGPKQLGPQLRVSHGESFYPDGSLFRFPPLPASLTPISRLFELCNIGSGQLTFASNQMVSGFGFSQIDTPPALSLDEDECTTLRVRFQASSYGDYFGLISIDSNSYGGDGTPWEISLEAGILDPQSDIRVMIDGLSQENQPILDFSTNPVVSFPEIRSFDICNDGDLDLVIQNPSSLITSGAAFTQVTVPTSPLPYNQCTSVTIQLDATVPGTYQGVLDLITNDPDSDENPYRIHLLGEATATQPDFRVLLSNGGEMVDEGQYIFPKTPVDQLPISRLFRICNDGPGTLGLQNSQSMVYGSGFVQIVFPPPTVAEGTCADLRVRFYTTSPGVYTGGIQIDSNGPPFWLNLAITAEQPS